MWDVSGLARGPVRAGMGASSRPPGAKRSSHVRSDCAEKEASAEGRDDDVARRLWEESARLVGLQDTAEL